jgi:hypothetical protein
MRDKIIFNFISQFLAFLRLATDDSFQDDQDIFDRVLTHQDLADVVGEVVKGLTVESLEVTQLLQCFC